jgi:hypothetical protein
LKARVFFNTEKNIHVVKTHKATGGVVNVYSAVAAAHDRT